MKLKTVRGVGGLCGEEMVASKGNFQCEVCFRDGITTKSNLKRHQRFYCKGGARVVPLTVDMKVVKVSEGEERRSEEVGGAGQPFTLAVSVGPEGKGGPKRCIYFLRCGTFTFHIFNVYGKTLLIFFVIIDCFNY